MSNSNAAAKALRLVWVPVQDAQGRTHMEMRWLDTQAPTATSMSHAA